MSEPRRQSRPAEDDPLQIELRRLNAGLTQEQLARRVGVSQQTISKWQRGESAPSNRNRARLDEVLGQAKNRQGLANLRLIASDTPGEPLPEDGERKSDQLGIDDEQSELEQLPGDLRTRVLLAITARIANGTPIGDQEMQFLRSVAAEFDVHISLAPEPPGGT